MLRLWHVPVLLTIAALLAQQPLAAQSRSVSNDSSRRLDSLAERRKQEQVRAAHERLRQLLRDADAYRRAGDRRMEGVTLRIAGNVYSNELGHPDSARVLYQQALEIAQAVGNRWDEFRAAYNIRLVQSNGVFGDSALVFWQEALAITRQAGDRATEGEVLVRISLGYQSYDSALAYARQAAEIARELGGRWDGGRGAFSAVGGAYLRLAQLDSAELYLREARGRARALHDQNEEAWALNELASVHGMRGRADSTLVYFYQALDLFRATGDRGAEANALNNIGEAHAGLGRSDSSLVYFRRSLTVSSEVGNRYTELSSFNNIGHVLLTQARPDSALSYFREALRHAPGVLDPRTIAYILLGLGEAQHALGQTDSALVNLRRSLAIHRDLGTRDAVAAVLSSIGTVHRDASRPDSALVNYSEGLRLARAADARDIEIELLGNLGDFYYQRGHRELVMAVAYYDSAAALRAAYASHAGSDAGRMSYAELGTDLYEHWALAWLGRQEEVGRAASELAALAVADRGRAQALLDLLRRGQMGDSAGALAGERSTLQRLGADLVQEGRELKAAVQAMGAPTLAYMTTKDTLLTWLVLPSGDVTLERQAIRRDSVTQLAAAIRTHLGADDALGRTVRSLEAGPPRAARNAAASGASTRARASTSAERFEASASALITSTLARQLPAGGELVIIPHGPIALVAFAALPVPPGPGHGMSRETLGARYAIRYAPSLTTLRVVTVRAETVGETRRPGYDGVLHGALVVGNPSMPKVATARGGIVRLPPLPGAEREGQWVAQALGVAPLTGRSATERAVRDRMGAAPVIHLATHGFAYSADAKILDSFVAFAPDATADGLLTVGEVIDQVHRLTAELVVLSACQTGLGNLRQAEGTVGLQRAFLAKGARSVLVSLWSVSDRATELLMRQFYTHWLRDADRPAKAEALRRAQSDVRRTPGFADPRFWAAFQLVGAR